MRIWRLERKEFLSEAFSGHGSALYPGRWNLYGSQAAYASESRSLALLEIIVHVSERELGKTLNSVEYYHIWADIPDEIAIKSLSVGDVEKISASWRDIPGPNELKIFGNNWLKSMETLVLQVPSAVLPKENNLIVNPRHPDFVKIRICDKPERYIIDSRLISKNS